MDGKKGIDKILLSSQIKSILVFGFFYEYNKLEKKIRQVFEMSLPHLPLNTRQQLYFYYGGKIGTYIEYEAHSIKMNCLNYKDDELFKGLSINQIVKIFKNTSCIEAFNFSIKSVRQSTTEFSFYDCVIRLLNMRNRLAHEVMDLNFKNQDLIELLSYEQFEKESYELLKNYDLQLIDDMTQYIASNIVYMRKILSVLDAGLEV